jgi:hypothetical protein
MAPRDVPWSAVPGAAPLDPTLRDRLDRELRDYDRRVTG